MQGLFTNKAGISSISLLAEVRAVHNGFLKDTIFMSTHFRGSNDACEIDFRSVGRSHDGTIDLSEGHFLRAP